MSKHGYLMALVLAMIHSGALVVDAWGAVEDTVDTATAEHGSPPRDIWQPSLLTTWKYQLATPVNTSYDVAMYDIDLFDASRSEIDDLHAQGRVAIAYFRAGAWEDWRPDAGNYPPALLGNNVDDWGAIRWVDISNLPLIQPLMEARLDLAVSKGFDGVEPAEMENYLAETGFVIDSTDQIIFNEWLAQAAHARGLVAGRLVDVVLDHVVANAGRNEAIWRGRDMSGRQLPSGTYFYSLSAGDHVETKRMILLK